MAHLCFARALCGVTRSASIQPVLFRNVQRCMSSGCPGYPWLKHGILCERNSMKIYVTSIEATYTKRSTFRMCTSSRLLSYQSSPDKKDDEIFKHGTWMGSRYVRPAGKLLKWIASKLMIVVDGYESFLEKKFPKAFKVYRTFAWGMRDFGKDLVAYTAISADLATGKPVRELSYKQLELYFTFPKDLIRVGPFILVSLLPFANYITFPIAYYFPRIFLSAHFWTLDQKINFATIKHKKRIRNARPVFRNLQAGLNKIPATIESETALPESRDVDLKEAIRNIYAKLGSGTHPTLEEITAVKPLFASRGTYGMLNLSSRHLSKLCGLHGLNNWFLGRRTRLWNLIGFMREMDLAISREGGPDQLDQDQLRRACFARGINPVGLSREQMIEWLTQWISLAKCVEGDSLSLLLHAPIWFAYNAPTNWRLLRGK